MTCNCPNIDDVLIVVEGVPTCQSTKVIPNIECPPGCNVIITGDGNAVCDCIDLIDPVITEVQVPIALTDPSYFEDVSFTIAYSLNSQSWVSYYDFEPNFYLAHNSYFQTGVNIANDNSELGLWSHLLTNKSFGVFYGKKYEVGVEYPIANDYASKTLEGIEIWSEAFRYHNEYDYAFTPHLTFNKLRVFNKREASGDLRLIRQKTLRDNSKYPITKDGYQEILATNTDDRWKVNYIWNRVDDEYRNQPIWNWDKNQIHKTFNNKIIRFKGKRVLEPMRGDFFLVYLGYDTDSRYSMEFKWATSKEDLV